MCIRDRIKESSLTDSDKLLEKLQDELAQIQIQKDQLEALNHEATNKINKYNRCLLYTSVSIIFLSNN